MALIEIDGLPFLIAWWIFPWRTVSHNQMVYKRLEDPKVPSVAVIMIHPLWQSTPQFGCLSPHNDGVLEPVFFSCCHLLPFSLV